MRCLPFVALLGLMASPALAADTSAAAPGRYTLTPTTGGFIRLDTQTGQVSQCTGTATELACKSTPDERAALEAEIDRLQKENDGLKAAATAQPTGGATIEVPSDKEVDKAFNFMDRVVKRFKDFIQELRKEQSDSTPL